MTQIERFGLPGIGTGYTLRTDDGRLLGVVCRRDGVRELVFYADGDTDIDIDTDTAERTLTLDPHEAQHIAELLRTP